MEHGLASSALLLPITLDFGGANKCPIREIYSTKNLENKYTNVLSFFLCLKLTRPTRSLHLLQINAATVAN